MVDRPVEEDQWSGPQSHKIKVRVTLFQITILLIVVALQLKRLTTSETALNKNYITVWSRSPTFRSLVKVQLFNY